MTNKSSVLRLPVDQAVEDRIRSIQVLEQDALADLAYYLESRGHRELARLYRDSGLRLGESYFVQTVTHYYVGKLAALTPLFMILEEASWVADAGRLACTLQQGLEAQKDTEIEPVGLQYVSIMSIVGVTVYAHPVPVEQK